MMTLSSKPDTLNNSYESKPVLSVPGREHTATVPAKVQRMGDGAADEQALAPSSP